MFNCDETGFNTLTKKTKVLVPVGRPANVLAPTEGKTNYSVLMCGNAAGDFTPPYVVYKGVEKSMPISWCLNGPPRAGYATTPNGWMSIISFNAWISFFDEYLKLKNIKKPVILLIDGCSSHVSLDIVLKAKDLGIILLKLRRLYSHAIWRVKYRYQQTVFSFVCVCVSNWLISRNSDEE